MSSTDPERDAQEAVEEAGQSTSTPRLTVREYVAQLEASGMSLSQIARESGVPYTSLTYHVRRGGGIFTSNANKMQEYSKNVVSAALTLGAKT